MKEIVDYITLKDLSVEKLDIRVMEYIGKGWQPYFGMLAGSGTELQGRVFLQTMVKYKLKS